jgi:hypothetical protein
MRAAILLALSLLAMGACGNNAATKHDAGVDDAPADAAGGPDASCFTNPQTHYEIINACTGAEKIFKPGRPPLENPDGSLPQLP